jgi:hypothetical protein
MAVRWSATRRPVLPRGGTRLAHHNPTTTAWRLTAFPGDPRGSMTSRNRLDTAHRALWR